MILKQVSYAHKVAFCFGHADKERFVFFPKMLINVIALELKLRDFSHTWYENVHNLNTFWTFFFLSSCYAVKKWLVSKKMLINVVLSYIITKY